MSEFYQVSIDGNLVILPSKIIQISNISRISSYVLVKSWKLKIATAVIALASYLGGQDVLHWGLTANAKNIMNLCALAFFMLFLYFLFYKRFGIKIQTNGVTTDVLITKDEATANKLSAMLAYFINNKESSITINSNLQIIEGDSIMGDKFNEIRNSVITNRSINNKSKTS